MYPSQNTIGECFDWFSVKYTPQVSDWIGCRPGGEGRPKKKKKFNQ